MITITKKMIKVLTLIVQGFDTREKIAKKLGLSSTWISDNLSKLEKLRFITKKRAKKVYLKLSETSFAQEFKNLVETKPYIKFENFLYGLNFRILSYCLFDWKTSQRIAKELRLNKKTVWNRLTVLKSRGLLTKKRKLYLTNKKAWPLIYSFLEKYRMFYTKKGRLLWKFEDELVFCVSDKEDVNGILTGFSQYTKLNIPVCSNTFCYYSPKKRLSKEEIFIHSILEISDSRQLMLALTFYLKYRLNENKLENLVLKYDCSEKLEDLKRLLRQEKTKIFSFIKEKELRGFFKQYEVKWKRN